MTMSGPRQVAVSNQRNRIPKEPVDLLVAFEELTNEELAWLSVQASDAKIRAYAGWELEYREAFGIEVGWDDGEWETARRTDPFHIVSDDGEVLAEVPRLPCQQTYVKRIVRQGGLQRKEL